MRTGTELLSYVKPDGRKGKLAAEEVSFGGKWNQS